MKREQLVKEIQATFELKSQKDGKEMLEKFEAMVEKLVLAGETLPFTLFEVGSKDVAEKSGVMKKEDGTELAWTKPAHKEGYVKAKGKLKKIFE